MARNKITISNVSEDLHDARLPESLGSAGQVPKINSAGTGFEYGAAGGDSATFNGSVCEFSTGSAVAVEANPETTTDTLTGIKIGDTSYAVGGGGSSTHLYQHFISMYGSSVTITLSITNDSATAFNTTTLASYLSGIGTSTDKLIAASGFYNGYSPYGNVVGIKYESSSKFGFRYINASGTRASTTIIPSYFYDVVTQIS